MKASVIGDRNNHLTSSQIFSNVCWDKIFSNQKGFRPCDGVPLICMDFVKESTCNWNLSHLYMMQGSALVNVYTDGSVLLSHGGVEMGQGLNTKVVQV